MSTPTTNAVRTATPLWRRRGAAAALAGVLVLGGLVARPWLRDRADVRRAVRLAGEGHFDEAEPALRQLHERLPGNVAVVRALALGAYDARRLADTETYLDRWCELQPGDREPHWRRLRFLMMQQKMAPAIAEAEHLLAIAPNDHETRVALVQLLLSDGRHEEAEREALRCYKEDPKSVDMWLTLAKIYHGLGRRPGGEAAAAKAVALTEQVLKEAPGHLPALKFRAKLYLEAGQPDRAVRLLKERVLRPADPESTEGLYELSEALFRAGRDGEAKQMQAELLGRQALALWSKNEHRDDNLGLQERVVEWMLDTGRADDAVTFLTGILERNPAAPPGTHRLLARCYDKQGRADRAAEQRRLADKVKGGGDRL